MWWVSRPVVASQNGTTQVASRSSRAQRKAAGMVVRPILTMVVTSIPLVMTRWQRASPISSKAVSTGMGPTPGISQIPNGPTTPERRASRSTRTWTTARVALAGLSALSPLELWSELLGSELWSSGIGPWSLGELCEPLPPVTRLTRASAA